MKSSRTQLIGKIHIAKKELGLDDDTYRSLLRLVVNKESAAKCTEPQLIKVLNALKEKGFKPKAANAYRTPAKSRVDITKLYALWKELYFLGAIKSGSMADLDKYVKRMTKGDVYCAQWLDEKRCQHLIECLKKWVLRVEKEKYHE